MRIIWTFRLYDTFANYTGRVEELGRGHLLSKIRGYLPCLDFGGTLLIPKLLPSSS